MKNSQGVGVWWDTLGEDIRMFRLVHDSSGVFKYFYYPDFRAVLIFRLSQLMFCWRITRPLAYLLTMLNDLVTGVWIGPRVEVGPGFFLGHPRGLVVNPGTKIGTYCSIMQRVTIGGPNVIIGDYVEINAGAQIVSNSRGEKKLTIGDHVIVGAGAVVVKNVPSGSVVVGVPAQVVKTLDAADNWVAFRIRRNQESGNHGE